MISPTECGSKSDISLATLDTQESSKNNKPFLSKIDHLSNLPVELKQKIAFNLNSKDYSHLRSTNKIISESLDSFSVMDDKLTQGGISGDVDKNIRKILRDKLLGGDQTKEITLSLKNCFSRPHRLWKGATEIGTTYLPDCFETYYQDRIYDVVESWRKGITSFEAYGPYKNFNPKAKPGQLWEVKTYFADSKINSESLNDIFSSFRKVYQDTEGTEKFVVAKLARTLRDYWLEILPGHVSKENMDNLSIDYPELFRAEENIL